MQKQDYYKMWENIFLLNSYTCFTHIMSYANCNYNVIEVFISVHLLSPYVIFTAIVVYKKTCVLC